MSHLHPNRKDLGSRGSRSPATASTRPAKRARMKADPPTAPSSCPLPQRTAGYPRAQAPTRQLCSHGPPKAPAQKHWAGEGRNREVERSAPKS